MRPILVLVDFTGTSQKAVDQAAAIAMAKGHAIVLCHVTEEGSEIQAGYTLKEYEKQAQLKGLSATSVIKTGSLNDTIEQYILELKPELVVAGTHGKKGLKQHLTGSKILKLVTRLKVPVLIVSDAQYTVEGGFKKVLLPIAPHSNYLDKVKAAIDLMADDGLLLLFTILKPGIELSEALLSNTERTNEYLTDKKINYQKIEIESASYALGYSKDTLNYAKANAVDLIGIMTEVSDENRYFGIIDKENLWVNKEGIAILSVNH